MGFINTAFLMMMLPLMGSISLKLRKNENALALYTKKTCMNFLSHSETAAFFLYYHK